MLPEHVSIATALKRASLVLAALMVAGLALPQQTALTRLTQSASTRRSVLSTGGGQVLLDPSDAVILLLDHQSGLFQTVKDISISELRANTATLAKLATLLKIPVITSASEPNGPLMPEIHELAPHAVFVPRKGEVNAWDNEDFRQRRPSDRKKDPHRRRGLDQRLRHVPGA
jgi:hypothetical protein